MNAGVGDLVRHVVVERCLTRPELLRDVREVGFHLLRGGDVLG
jgi:hypothetical protein